ncbi:phosphatidylinositol N-acetylglucosaminyltransferase subunit Q isoform X2 [Hyposmocoma kahamanoa]|uniref:phosphatidylinositol N-acetylglucosaminyltransferase subunit Q isoform X2 n=1 Tax=Hyposmocoma kahamanoa TaxID=1477025 RepID=UPI000E6D5FA7|nr:phosphatidylinositol N-acetylglucosaminyltransferase subunit Q isoform X2 [Hyposmocoma kahamanoa]
MITRIPPIAMLQPIRIMFPTFPINNKVITYFTGYLSITEVDETIIYITEYSTSPDLIKHQSNDNTICGYCSTNLHRKHKISSRTKNYLVIEQGQSLQINKLLLSDRKIEATDNCIIMLYDYERMKHSEAMSDTADYFFNLKTLLQDEPCALKTDFEPILMHTSKLSSSMFAQHLLNYFNILVWLVQSVKGNKKISIRTGNLILAILTDIMLGYLALKLLTSDKKELGAFLMGMLEKLVNLLHTLLKWLMGAPAGLKLNNAFNKMLGQYFSYHIQLWWLFLEVSGEKLDTILNVYHYLGYLGFTFQAAIISDMICIATFHSYCIYVYAARLFNMQVSGLIALLRLFVGRKYNPLRGGIDSCEYTNQELFVGTVAFTILLLLLPTTTMYYIVFTLETF